MSERFAQHLRPMPFAALGSYATAIIDDDGDMVGFDREPGPGGSRGQIISYGRDREATTVVASDLVAFLRKIEGSVR